MNRFALLLLPVLASAGCTRRSVPVFGVWRGEQPGPSDSVPNSVDLTLEGGPDARTGHYRISTLVYGGTVDLGSHDRVWGGTWVREDRASNGRQLTVIRLLDPLPGDIAAYALLPDGSLHALDPDGRLDQSRRAALYTLSSVPTGAGEAGS